MNQTSHHGRAYYIDKLTEQLTIFAGKVQTSVKNNLPNINVLSETIMGGLLNRIHAWNLVNANSIRQNFPGIDLVDPEAKIGIQVTSTNTLQKVDHTLEQVAKLPADVEIAHLYILVITQDNPTASMKGRKQAPYFSGGNDIWNIPTLIRQMMDLEATKLEEISAYLDTELGNFLRYTEQKYLNLPPSSALGKSSFVGREAELADIRERIDNGEKLIVLSGLGGMGKTELAVRFGQEYRDGAVYFIRFEDSFTHTVAKMAQGIRPALSQDELSRPDEELCDDVLKILESCGENDLIIIDNVDADEGSLSDLMKDSIYKKLRSMKLRLILTTRFDRDRAVGVRPMPNKTLYGIFEKHSVSLEETQMDALIDAVNGHTLTIDLMARTLNGKGWRKVTAEMMLKSIQDNTLPSEKYRKIATDYSQSPDQAQIYQHLSVVFDAKHIPEDAKNVLRCATLLPADGMNGEYFHEALSEAEQNAFETLIDHGWLNAENGLVTIHPVIRLVCREELKPSDETCGDFLNALWGQLGRDEYDRVKFAQMAELFALAADDLEDAEAEWLNYSGCLYGDLAQRQKEKELYEKHLPALEARLPIHPSLATAYNNVGATYGALGNHQKALEYLLNALAIREKVLPQDHPDLAISYGNVGTTYSDLGKHNKALRYRQKALAIHEKVLPPDHPDLVTSYNNVGTSYSDLGEHNKALEYQLKALAIKEKVLLLEDHPSLATSYNNVGMTYGDLGDHRKALDYQLKALAIYEKVLPPDHPSLAASYNNVGCTYSDLGDPKKALEYKLKALAICEKVLPQEHPGLAQSYNSVGCTYGDLGDHQKALEYKLKALAICEKVLPQDHPNLATSYNNVGYTYGRLGNDRKALALYEKALAIREKSLPAGHPNIESSRRNIAIVKRRLENAETSG